MDKDQQIRAIESGAPQLDIVSAGIPFWSMDYKNDRLVVAIAVQNEAKEITILTMPASVAEMLGIEGISEDGLT